MGLDGPRGIHPAARPLLSSYKYNYNYKQGVPGPWLAPVESSQLVLRTPILRETLDPRAKPFEPELTAGIRGPTQLEIWIW